MLIISKSKKGFQANKTLNKLASKLEKTYKTPNLKFGFEMGIDGIWEFVVKNIKTNKALVLKENPEFNNCHMAFLYLQSFESPAQPTEDLRQYVKNEQLFQFVQACIKEFSK